MRIFTVTKPFVDGEAVGARQDVEWPDGIELSFGHPSTVYDDLHRQFEANHEAGLDTIAVRVVDLSEGEAALHYAQDHLWSLDEMTARQTVRALAARWGKRVLSLPSVAYTVDRLGSRYRTDGVGSQCD